MKKRMNMPILAEDTYKNIVRTMKSNSSRKTGLINLNREDVAVRAGVSIRTVDRALTKLRMEKVITTKLAKNYFII